MSNVVIYNIRGTNGSGKSTLARAFIRGNPAAEPNRPGVDGSPTMVDLARYPAPTTRDRGRTKVTEGYANPAAPGEDLDVLVVGSYRTACGGLDGFPDFKTTFASLEKAVALMERHGTAPRRAVLAEGVLSSTVWGSWGEFADRMRACVVDPVRVAFCYLDTPVEVCLQRIRQRQEAAGKVRDINEALVRDKVKAIAATRLKALAAGHIVYDLPWENAYHALYGIMGDVPNAISSAREVYRAR